MSVYQPANGIEGSYIGAKIWWRQLYEDGLNGAGRIYGYVWDTDNNGVIIEFPQVQYISRYFLTHSDLETTWKEGMFYISEAKFIGIALNNPMLVTNKVLPLGVHRQNKQRIPVWTQFR